MGLCTILFVGHGGVSFDALISFRSQPQNSSTPVSRRAPVVIQKKMPTKKGGEITMEKNTVALILTLAVAILLWKVYEKQKQTEAENASLRSRILTLQQEGGGKMLGIPAAINSRSVW